MQMSSRFDCPVWPLEESEEAFWLIEAILEKVNMCKTCSFIKRTRPVKYP